MAQEVLKSELDLFKKVSFQGSIENSQLIQYRPSSALNASSTIEFDIPISSDEYLDLQNVYLWVKGTVTKADGTNFLAAQNRRFSLINYSLNTIFDQLSIYLGGTLVSQSSKTYHYLSFIEAITQMSVSSQSTFLKAAGLKTISGVYDFDAVDIDLGDSVKQSKPFSLYGRLHGSIFNSDRLLLNGVPLHLIFSRAPNDFTVMGSALQAQPALDATDPKLNLTEVSVFVRKVKLAPNLLNAHAKALQLSKATYPIKRSLIKVLNLPAGQSTFVLDNVFMGQMPSKLIMGLVTNNAYSGALLLNPLKFAHNDLSFLCVHMNGESFPKNPYEPDYRDATLKYEREYFDFLMNIGATKSNMQPNIDYENYRKGFCFYAFNFNSDFEHASENDYINIPKEGFLNIEVKFQANLAEALKMICYAQFDNVIEIDEMRNVTVDYS